MVLGDGDRGDEVREEVEKALPSCYKAGR